MVAYDIDEKRRDVLAAIGGDARGSIARDVLDKVECLLLSLPNSDVVEAVVTALQSQLAPGFVILDTTTGEPDRTAALAASLAAKGIRYCDCWDDCAVPVSRNCEPERLSFWREVMPR